MNTELLIFLGVLVILAIKSYAEIFWKDKDDDK